MLELLAQHVATKVRPELVDTAYSTNELKLTVSKIKQILKIMHDMGVIESGMGAEYSLITRMGRSRVDC